MDAQSDDEDGAYGLIPHDEFSRKRDRKADRKARKEEKRQKLLERQSGKVCE